jgi:hypothetical protein
VTLITFQCAQCTRTTPIRSRPRGVLERLSTWLPLFRYYRCKYCGERYTAIGFGESRLVILQKTWRLVRTLIILTLFFAAVVALIFLLAYLS